MAESSKSHEIDYATVSKVANIRRIFKIVLCALTFLLSLFIVVAQPEWGLQHHGSSTIYRFGLFERSLGFSRSVEEVPMGPLPPPTKFEFIGFTFINGTAQVESERVVGRVITEQWRITGLAIPVWLLMLISFVIFVLAFKPRRLTNVFTRDSDPVKTA